MKKPMMILAIAYVLAMAFFLTFPGLIPFNSIEPRVLGVPFVMIWYLIWIVGAFVVLSLLHKAYQK